MLQLRRARLLTSRIWRSRGFQRCMSSGYESISSSSSKKLEGQVAIITGAARGIGASASRLFVENGAHVVVVDINESCGRTLVEELGPWASFYKGDVSQEKDVAGIVDSTVSKFGKLDIMFNNAAYAGTGDAVHLMDMEKFDKCYGVNLRGVALGIKHAARVMIPVKRGSILSMCTVGGILGGCAPTMYSYTKGAIVQVTRHAAAELGPYGIRVNCISPSGCYGPGLLAYLRSFPGHEEDSMEHLAIRMEQISSLRGQYLTPEIIAKSALFLASDDASYCSGQNMIVDGGFTVSKSYPIVKAEDEYVSPSSCFEHEYA